MAEQTPLDRLFAEHPEAVAATQRLMDTVLRPLDHFTCPTCDVRFGLERAEWAFDEQTGSIVFCPRGHRLAVQFGGSSSPNE